METELPSIAIDYAFLDQVEAEIVRSLEQATQLESGLAELQPRAPVDWLGAFDRLNANLANWENKLAELSQQAAATDADLTDQHEAVRAWMQSMADTSARLAQASGHATA